MKQLALTGMFVTILVLGTRFLHNVPLADGQDNTPLTDERFCADANGDGALNIADALKILNYLFDPQAASPYCISEGVALHSKPTVIYFVRHAEVSEGSLTAEGHARAALLARHFAVASITHVFASHLLRTLQTVEPLAAFHGLSVEQLPSPATAGPSTPTFASTIPTIEALQNLPEGSAAVVGGHSDTLFAIMAGLGVRIGTAGNPCDPGDTSCLRCTDHTCFDRSSYSGLWMVTLGSTPSAEAKMVNLRYGGDICEEP